MKPPMSANSVGPFFYWNINDLSLTFQEQNNDILNGTLHCQKNSCKTKLLRLPKKPFSSLKTRKFKNIRLKKASKYLRLLEQGCKQSQQENFKEFFFNLLDREKLLVQDYFDERNKLRKLSPEETLDFIRVMKWSGSQFRKMKRILKSINRDIFASFALVECCKKERLKGLDLVTSKKYFWQDTKKTKSALCNTSQVRSLYDSVMAALAELKGKVWYTFQYYILQKKSQIYAVSQ